MTIAFYPTASVAAHSTMGAGLVVSNIRPGSRHGLPASIPTDQLLFWTRRWQAGEAESAAAREAGDVVEFENGFDAVRWLLSEED